MAIGGLTCRALAFDYLQVMTSSTLTPTPDARIRERAVEAYVALFQLHMAGPGAMPGPAGRLFNRWLPELSSELWHEIDPEAIAAIEELSAEAERVQDPRLALQWLSTYPSALLALRAVKFDGFEVTIRWSSAEEDDWDDMAAESFWPDLESFWGPLQVRSDEPIEYALAA